MVLRDEVSIIEKNLQKALDEGKLSQDTINSNFIELWYIQEFHNAKISVNGIEHGPGWAISYLPNLETIRTVWSKLRHKKDKDREQEYKELFRIKD